MANQTHYSELEKHGFQLQSEERGDAGGRLGQGVRRHYTMTRGTPGLAPVTHHVVVDEYKAKPGKYNVSYHVTQGREPYADGDYDMQFSHEANDPAGVLDPIRTVLTHHSGVRGAIGTDAVLPMRSMEHADLGNFVRRPEYGLRSVNSAPDAPLDTEIHRRLTTTSEGKPKFFYAGRFPGESGTDLYHAVHEDPESPNTFSYEFTIRHRPEATNPFSYNAVRRQNGVDAEGKEDEGSFLDVTGNSEPVATFDTSHKLVRRHNDILRALGIMSPAKRRKTAGVREGLEGQGWTAHESPIGSGYVSHYTKPGENDQTHMLIKDGDGWTHVLGVGEPNEWGEYEHHAQNPVSYMSLREALMATQDVPSIPMTAYDSRPPQQKYNSAGVDRDRFIMERADRDLRP